MHLCRFSSECTSMWFLSVCRVFSRWPHWRHSKERRKALCLTECLWRARISLKHIEHSLQLKGRSTLCDTWCSFSAALVGYPLPHSSQTNGRSPIWTIRMCICTLSARVNVLSHSGQGWIFFCVTGRWHTACRSIFFSDTKNFGHWPHSKGKTLGVCLFRMCSMYRRGCSKVISQIWHHTSVPRMGFFFYWLLLIFSIFVALFSCRLNTFDFDTHLSISELLLKISFWFPSCFNDGCKRWCALIFEYKIWGWFHQIIIN